MNGLLDVLKQEPQALSLDEKKALSQLGPQLRYQEQLRIIRSISQMKNGANMTPFTTVSVLGPRLLVVPDELRNYHEYFYRRIEGWIFCQKGRRRRVYWVEPKLELLEVPDAS